MTYHLNAQGARVVLDPAEAASEIVALFRACGGRTCDVAACLGVSRSTVKRWVQGLDAGGAGLRAAIERMRHERRSANAGR